jgi:pyruvate kinase
MDRPRGRPPPGTLLAIAPPAGYAASVRQSLARPGGIAITRSLNPYRRTKIVCTLGPATETLEQIRALFAAGMDVARLNFSHQSIEWHQQRAAMVRQIARESGCPIGILQDLPGPKIRVGVIPDGPVELRAGQEFVLTTDGADGNAQRASVNHETLDQEVEPDDAILLADGTIRLRVVRVEPQRIICEVDAGGMLSSRKGVNLPSRTLSLPAMTDYDRKALAAGLDMGVDFVALSFVRSRADVELARAVMAEHGRQVPIIAKIEKHEAVQNLEDIIEAVDAVMVARGDLAVEIPLWDVPQVQKRIISAANEAAKPVITATQMLLSMVDSPRPARAETSDVANALYDGTDALMLSEETAVGNYPVEAVEVMAKICVATEAILCTPGSFRPLPNHRRHLVPDAVAAAACMLARHLQATALVVPTRTGSTAVKVGACRPSQPIVAIGTHLDTVGRMTIVWGVVPIYGEELLTHESMLMEAERRAEAAGLIKEGDLLVITAGFPVGGPGSTNTVTVKTVGEQLSTISSD